MRRRLPPFGRRYLQQGCDLGPWIAIGPEAWKVAKMSTFPRMVLPYGERPATYRWPVHDQIVTVTEEGIDDPSVIKELARLLIQFHGAKAVIARRWVGGLMTFVRKPDE